MSDRSDTKGHPSWYLPLACALVGLGMAGPAFAQPGFGTCLPPLPPPAFDGEDRLAFELAADAYFDEVSNFYACHSERLRTLRRDYTAQMEAEIANLRVFYRELIENEEAVLREDKALVDQEYRAVLDAFEALP